MLKWFECEEENRQNIISSKIRLARNWNEYVFPSRLSKEDSQEMVKCLCAGAEGAYGHYGFAEGGREPGV